VGGIAREALAAIPGREVDTAILAMLEHQDAKVREQAIALVSQRRVQDALPKLLKAAGDAEPKVRLESIKALGALAGQAEFAALVELAMKAPSPGESQAWENALGAICTREARFNPSDVTVVKAVYGDLENGPSADVSKKVLELIQSGKLTIEATNDHFGDPAPGVQKRFLLEYAIGGTSERKTVAENESVTITGGITPAACVDPLCAAMDKAPKEMKVAFLRVMRTARGPKVLEAVRAAVKDPDPDVKVAAIGTLCDWTVEALPDIRELAASAPDPKSRILALRGLLRLIPQQQLPADRKLAELKDVIAKIERPEEKRLSLAALSSIASPEALTMAMASVADPAVKDEACLAALAIAEKIVAGNGPQVAGAMEQVLATVKNKAARTRAQELLDQARKAR